MNRERTVGLCTREGLERSFDHRVTLFYTEFVCSGCGNVQIHVSLADKVSYAAYCEECRTVTRHTWSNELGGGVCLAEKEREDDEDA